MNIVGLEKYLSNKQKMFLLYFVVTLLFGTIQMFGNGNKIAGLLCFIGLVVTVSLLFAKKGLISNSNGIYQGLILEKIVLYKQKIDIDTYKQILIFENNAPQNIPWWTDLTIDMFINDNAYTFYLANEELKKKKYLMSFKEKDSMDNGLRFFRNYTKLKLEFIEAA